MSNSPLVVYTKISPNSTNPRKHVIDTITIHCMAGNCSIETCGDIFVRPERKASSNYGIGSDGRIGMYVEEKNRSWCTSSSSNDERAITIEVANNGGEPNWPVSGKAYESLILLLTDICRRNNIKQLLWKADKSLIGQVDKQNMTVHRWFANKSCPGEYLYRLHGDIAKEVNKKLETRIKEVEDVDFSKLTDEEVDILMARIAKRFATQPVSAYAKESCEKGVKSGLFSDGDKDGLVDNPRGFLLRQEFATVLNRAGLLDKKY